jgi:hypothetical protein
MELKDQSIRECFIHEHNRNFSVIAPAGTGKTTARTRRIANIAVRQSIPPEKLIIVTYTNKAAEELRQRTLWEVKKINGSLNLYNKISAEQSTLLPTNCCENMDILSILFRIVKLRKMNIYCGAIFYETSKAKVSFHSSLENFSPGKLYMRWS